MPLLLLDLDNTLVDRAAAFRGWAVAFSRRHGDRPEDVDWLIDVDGDGYPARDQVAERIRARFALDRVGAAALVNDLRLGMVDWITLDPAVPAALSRARAAGWTPFVVTNGPVEQQERKLRSTGLGVHLAGWVISEAAGTRKPAPAIFQLAARRAGQPLAGGWMIGDSAESDVGGAQACGLSSVWLRRGRPWALTGIRPTAVADTLPEAVDQVLRVSGRARRPWG